jgi:hypothetical protein
MAPDTGIRDKLRVFQEAVQRACGVRAIHRRFHFAAEPLSLRARGTKMRFRIGQLIHVIGACGASTGRFVVQQCDLLF